MPKGIPKNGINKGWFKKGKAGWNKDKKGLQKAWNKGLKMSKASRERNRQVHLGKKASAETREKMSLAHIGNCYSKGYKHTKEAKRKISLSSKANQNANWKGGITPELQKIRGTSAYKQWRLAVYSKDHYSCQKCNKKGGTLNAHHIENFSSNTLQRFNINNGIALCEGCHKKFHKKYGIKNNTLEQVLEYLKN